jgi:hypothetical protein
MKTVDILTATIRFYISIILRVPLKEKDYAAHFCSPGFLPNKPGALHPVASSTFQALTCFCLFGLRPKIQAIPLPWSGMVVDRQIFRV